MKGHSAVFIAGGIGLAPVRCAILNVLDLRGQFKDVTIIYGARTVAIWCTSGSWKSGRNALT